MEALCSSARRPLPGHSVWTTDKPPTYPWARLAPLTHPTAFETDNTTLLERTFDVNRNPTISAPANLAATCAQALADLEAFRNGVNASVLALVVNQRLGNLKDTGKSGVRLQAINTLKAYLQANYPELVDPVFTAPTGVDPINNPLEAKIDALASLFVESDQYLITGEDGLVQGGGW